MIEVYKDKNKHFSRVQSVPVLLSSSILYIRCIEYAGGTPLIPHVMSLLSSDNSQDILIRKEEIRLCGPRASAV